MSKIEIGICATCAGDARIGTSDAFKAAAKEQGCTVVMRPPVEGKPPAVMVSRCAGEAIRVRQEQAKMFQEARVVQPSAP